MVFSNLKYIMPDLSGLKNVIQDPDNVPSGSINFYPQSSDQEDLQLSTRGQACLFNLVKRVLSGGF